MPYPAKTEASAILAAALAIVEQQGWPALSMRSIAAALGVRASSLYHHYPDRAALESALATLAAKSLLAALQPAVGIKAISLAYVQFAQENPALYKLISGPDSAAGSQPESKAVWNLLLAAIASQSNSRRDPTPTAVAFWSFLHGYVTLEAAGKFGPSGPRGALEKGITALAKGFA